MPLEVVEYTDPACPWAWGSEPKFRFLRAKLPDARWRRVFGILFDDDEDPPSRACRVSTSPLCARPWRAPKSAKPSVTTAVGTLLIRGFSPLADARDYGTLVRLVRERADAVTIGA